jgi:hypothetical protein
MGSAKNAAAHSLEGGRSAGPIWNALYGVLVALLAAWIAVPLIAQDNGAQPVGFPTDWSSNHLIFTASRSVQSQTESQRDPRYGMQWMRGNLPRWREQLASDPWGIGRRPLPAPPRQSTPAPSTPTLARDWNFSQQTTTYVLRYVYPAKYTFNPIAVADCAKDYVIFGLNVPGATGQANLMGVNNLYVGSSGGCSTIASNGGSGTAPTPEVEWAYNVTQSGSTTGQIRTSVVLSADGKKVAYVLTPTAVGSSAPLQLQVLTLGAKTGTVTAPTAATCSSSVPATLFCLNLSITANHTNTYSAIYVDYATGNGYVGDDAGSLYQISNVFSSTTAPAITRTITAGTASLSPPVYDGATDTVFVGSSNGNLYGFTGATGGAITNSPLSLAASDTTHAASDGIEAAPVVDSTNHVLYAFYGTNAGSTAAQVAQVVYYDHSAGAVEFKTSATAGTPGSTSTAVAGTNLATFATTSAGMWPISDGAFSQSYFSGFDTNTSFLYACGTNSTSSPWGVSLQQFNFDSNMKLLSSGYTVSNVAASTNGAGNTLCSPLTEFYNTSGAATDWLFFSLPNEPPPARVVSYNLTGETLHGALTLSASDNVGSSAGIIVDGADTSISNASSLYFASRDATSANCTTSGTANPANTGIGSASAVICAYKLTQSGLH